MRAYTKIKMTAKDGVALIRLNSPETMNALEAALFDELQDATDVAAADDSIGAVILTGAGRTFCAGGDLKRFAEGFSPDEGHQYMKHFAPWVEAFAGMPKPTIAAVNSYAVGAGFCVALHADLVITSRAAKFGMAFASVGLVPDLGGLYALPRLVGLSRAKELVFTGRMVTAEEALEMGFVNRVVEPETLEHEALTLAKQLADGPRVAHRMAKRLLNASGGLSLRGLLEEEATAQALCIQTQDHKNAVKTFFKKEKPVFKGK